MMITPKTKITDNDFRTLAGTTDFNCVSLYCSLSDDIEESRNTFINLLQKLKDRLNKKNITGDSYYNIIKPLEQIYNNVDFWKKDIVSQNKSLVIFLNENNSDLYLLEKELENGLHMTSNYYLLPLFNKVSGQQLTQDSTKIKQVVFDEDMTTNRVEKIIPMAYDSKIDTLYVSSKNGVYGVYDEVNKTIMIDNEGNSGNMSLINLAAITTYMCKGKVFLVDPIDMPTSGVSIQAILKS